MKLMNDSEMEVGSKSGQEFRATVGRGGMTDWELMQVKLHPDWWGRIKWIKDGKPAENPFE